MLERGTTVMSTSLAFLCIAFAPGLTDRAAAQAPAGATTPQAAPAPNANTTMTLTGCLMKEADYRKAHNIGDNPVNRLGEGDEFVLVDTAPAAAAPGSSSPSQPSSARRARPSPASNPCREAGTGPAYRMTGKLEDELKGFEGHRMQITGKFEHASDAQIAAGQKAATLPAEVEISAYQEVTAVPAQTARAQTPTPRSATPESVQARNEPARTAPQDTNRGNLPRTASDGPLIALGGLALLAIAGVLRLARGTAA